MAKHFNKENAKEYGAMGGRKSPASSLMARKIQKRFIKRFEKDADELYEAWLDRAKGVAIVIERIDKEGNRTVEKVYREKPSDRALKDMHNRALGKPSQPIEFESPPDIDIDLGKEATKLLKELEKYEKTKLQRVVKKTGKSKKKPTRNNILMASKYNSISNNLFLQRILVH